MKRREIEAYVQDADIFADVDIKAITKEAKLGWLKTLILVAVWPWLKTVLLAKINPRIVAVIDTILKEM